MALPTRPKDPNQLGKMIVDMSVGDIPVDHGKPDDPVPEPTGNAKSAKARAASQSPERRREVARHAAAARWET